jgi:hypothetical protein
MSSGQHCKSGSMRSGDQKLPQALRRRRRRGWWRRGSRQAGGDAGGGGGANAGHRPAATSRGRWRPAALARLAPNHPTHPPTPPSQLPTHPPPAHPLGPMPRPPPTHPPTQQPIGAVACEAFTCHFCCTRGRRQPLLQMQHAATARSAEAKEIEAHGRAPHQQLRSTIRPPAPTHPPPPPPNPTTPQPRPAPPPPAPTPHPCPVPHPHP